MNKLISIFNKLFRQKEQSALTQSAPDEREIMRRLEEDYFSYRRVRNTSKILDYYLGRDIYFIRDDWGTHDTSTTFYRLEKYAYQVGNAKMLQSFKKDLETILYSTLNISDFLHTINYIWIYSIHFYENKNSPFTIEWRVEKKIRSLIVKQFNYFPVVSLEENYKQLTDEWLYQQLYRKLENIKKRFGIDLLDVSGASDIPYQNLI